MTSLFRGVRLAPIPVYITLRILGTKAALTHNEPSLPLLHCNSCLQRAHTGFWVGSSGQVKLLPQSLQVCPLHFLQNLVHVASWWACLHGTLALGWFQFLDVLEP